MKSRPRDSTFPGTVAAEDDPETILGISDLVEYGSPWTGDSTKATWALRHLGGAVTRRLES